MEFRPNEQEMEEAIVKTAFQLMKKFGIRNFTMDMLSSEMGVSKKTLYQYYSTKEEILAECIRHTIDELQQENERVLKSDRDAMMKAVEILHLNLSVGFSFQDSFMFDMKKYYPAVFRLTDEYTHGLFEHTIFDLLTEAQKAGVLLKEVDCRLSCEFYMLKVREVIAGSQAFATHAFDEVFNHFVVYNLRGLLTNESLHLFDPLLKK